MHKSFVDDIYTELKEKIISLEYSPNEMITEQSIADSYAVSKTPAREALNALCQEGLLVRYPRKGYIVKEINIEEFQQILCFRLMIESEVIEMVIKNCSDDEISKLYDILVPIKSTDADFYNHFRKVNWEFHTKLTGLLKNKYVSETLIHLLNTTCRPLTMVFMSRVSDNMNQDHIKVVDALLARDVDLAKKLLAEDLGV